MKIAPIGFSNFTQSTAMSNSGKASPALASLSSRVGDRLNLSLEYRRNLSKREGYVAVDMSTALRPSEIDEETKENYPPYGTDCWIALPNSKIMHVLPEGSDPQGYTWAQAEYHPAVELLSESNNLPIVFNTPPKEWAEAFAPETMPGDGNKAAVPPLADFSSDISKLDSKLLEWFIASGDSKDQTGKADKQP